MGAGTGSYYPMGRQIDAVDPTTQWARMGAVDPTTQWVGMGAVDPTTQWAGR